MDKLEKVLRETFEDHRLLQDEKYAFRELLNAYSHNSNILNFVRNKAFDIVNQYMQEKQSFDLQSYKWLEHIVKSIDSVRIKESEIAKNEVYFSPGDNCKNRIISLINSAVKSVNICVFTISDNEISDAIYSAFKRKVLVRIITDNDKANDMGSDVNSLEEKGLSVVKDKTSSHMHHKFALIDATYLINGSFNWTRSASKNNNENITILTDPELIAKFTHKFEEMWQNFTG